MYEETNLTKVIKESFSIREVLQKLGYKPTNTTQREIISSFILKHNIDTSHFKKEMISRWSDINHVKRLVATSSSIGEFLEKFGLVKKGSNYQYAKRKFKELNIDVSHFVKNGNGYTRGNKKPIPLKDILMGKYPTYSRYSLKRRLLAEGVKENKCEKCSIGPIWNSKPLTLHLDHINGVFNDNRLENLRFLCPNCHSQTSTYGGRNCSLS